MSDIIDLTNVSTISRKPSAKKSTSKEKTTMKTTTKKTKTTKSASKKVSAKKNKKSSTPMQYSIDAISASVKKAFAGWKKGELSLNAAVAQTKAKSRDSLWRQFRLLAGGDNELHRLRAAGAGDQRGKLRFGKKATVAKKGKAKGKAKA